MTQVIGIDIGGTKILTRLSNGGPEGSRPIAHATPAASRPDALAGLVPGSAAHEAASAAGRAALLDTVIRLCRRLIAEADSPVEAIGIGTAGRVDSAIGLVFDASDNLVGWKGTRLAESVRAAVGLPTYVDNDARVMALAELTHGAARGRKQAICLTIGTGIGGALIQDGRVWHGAHSSAGEIGYLYAGPGEHIESRCSGPAIARRYAEAHGVPPIPLTAIAARAKAGDHACAQAIGDGGYELGRILAPLFLFIDPEAVVVGGGVPEIGPRWWDPFTEAVRTSGFDRLNTVPIMRAALGPAAGMIGAGVLAVQRYQQEFS